MVRAPVAQHRSPHARWLAAVPVTLTIAVASLLLFAWLAQEMLASRIQQFDITVRSNIHQHASTWLTTSMEIVTNLGDWPVIMFGTIGLLLLFWYRGARDYVQLVLITMIGAGILDGTLKLAFHRIRPDPFFGTRPNTYSFPSGHALISLCFYGLIAGMLSLKLEERWQRVAVWTVALFLIAAVGFSRIYLGVHWPSDVLAGYAAALMWMGAIRQLAHRLEKRHLRKQAG
jgi:undecaprenyl-diphosphatase